MKNKLKGTITNLKSMFTKMADSNQQESAMSSSQGFSSLWASAENTSPDWSDVEFTDSEKKAGDSTVQKFSVSSSESLNAMLAASEANKLIHWNDSEISGSGSEEEDTDNGPKNTDMKMKLTGAINHLKGIFTKKVSPVQEESAIVEDVLDYSESDFSDVEISESDSEEEDGINLQNQLKMMVIQNPFPRKRRFSSKFDRTLPAIAEEDGEDKNNYSVTNSDWSDTESIDSEAKRVNHRKYVEELLDWSDSEAEELGYDDDVQSNSKCEGQEKSKPAIESSEDNSNLVQDLEGEDCRKKIGEDLDGTGCDAETMEVNSAPVQAVEDQVCVKNSGDESEYLLGGNDCSDFESTHSEVVEEHNSNTIEEVVNDDIENTDSKNLGQDKVNYSIVEGAVDEADSRGIDWATESTESEREEEENGNSLEDLVNDKDHKNVEISALVQDAVNETDLDIEWSDTDSEGEGEHNSNSMEDLENEEVNNCIVQDVVDEADCTDIKNCDLETGVDKETSLEVAADGHFGTDCSDIENSEDEDQVNSALVQDAEETVKNSVTTIEDHNKSEELLSGDDWSDVETTDSEGEEDSKDGSDFENRESEIDQGTVDGTDCIDIEINDLEEEEDETVDHDNSVKDNVDDKDCSDIENSAPVQDAVVDKDCSDVQNNALVQDLEIEIDSGDLDWSETYSKGEGEPNNNLKEELVDDYPINIQNSDLYNEDQVNNIIQDAVDAANCDLETKGVDKETSFEVAVDDHCGTDCSDIDSENEDIDNSSIVQDAADVKDCSEFKNSDFESEGVEKETTNSLEGAVGDCGNTQNCGQESEIVCNDDLQQKSDIAPHLTESISSLVPREENCQQIQMDRNDFLRAIATTKLQGQEDMKYFMVRIWDLEATAQKLSVECQTKQQQVASLISTNATFKEQHQIFVEENRAYQTAITELTSQRNAEVEKNNRFKAYIEHLDSLYVEAQVKISEFGKSKDLIVEENDSLKNQLEHLQSVTELNQADMEKMKKDLSRHKEVEAKNKDLAEELEILNQAYNEDVLTLQTRNSKLEKNFKEKRDELVALNTYLNAQVEMVHAEAKEMHDMIKKLEAEKMSLQESKEFQELFVAELQSAKSVEEERHNALVSENGELKTKNQDLHEKILELTSSLSSSEAECKELVDHNEIMKDELKTLDLCEERNTALVSENGKLKTENQDLHEKILELTSSLSSSEAECKELVDENEIIKSKLIDSDICEERNTALVSENGELKTKNQDLHDQIIELTSSLSASKAEFQKCVQHNEIMKDELKDLDLCKLRNSALLSENGELKTENQDLHNQILELTHSLSSSEANCKELVDKNEIMKDELKNSDLCKSSLVQQNETLKLQVDDLEMTLKEKQDEKADNAEFQNRETFFIEENKREFDEIKSQLTGLRQELRAQLLPSENKQLIDTLKTEVVELRELVEKLNGNLESHKITIQELQQKLDQRFEEEIVKNVKECLSSVVVSGDVSIGNTDREELYETYSKLVEKSEQERNNLLDTVSEYKDSLEMNMDQVISLSADILELKSKNAEFQNKDKQSRKEIHQLKVEVTDLAGQLEDANVTIGEKECLIEMQTTTIETLRNSLVAEVTGFKDRINERKIKEKAQMDNHKVEVTKLKSEMRDVHCQLEEAQHILEGRNEQVENQNAKIVDLESSVQELQTNLDISRQTINGLEENLHNVKEHTEIEKKHLLATIDELETSQKSLREEASSLFEEVVELRARNVELQRQNDHSEPKMKEMTVSEKNIIIMEQDLEIQEQKGLLNSRDKRIQELEKHLEQKQEQTVKSLYEELLPLEEYNEDDDATNQSPVSLKVEEDQFNKGDVVNQMQTDIKPTDADEEEEATTSESTYWAAAKCIGSGLLYVAAAGVSVYFYLAGMQDDLI